MLMASGSTSQFAVEAVAEVRIRREVRRQDLDRDGAIEPRVTRLVNLAHPTGADKREDLVGAEPDAGIQRHKW